jgi:phosphate transport system substrate-binding protein
MKNWQNGFRKYHPGIAFENTVPSSATAIGGLYTGVADLGVMGREIWPIERLAFCRVFQYEPLEITVGTGSFDVNGRTSGPVVFVHRENPISRLTVRQLDGIFGEERTGGWRGMKWSRDSARSARENIRTWGQLGLTGAWADETIRVYGYEHRKQGLAFAFERMVFAGGDKWTPGLREMVSVDPNNQPGREGRVWAGQQIVDKIGRDKYAIGYTGINFRTPQVKPLALATKEGNPYVEPTAENFQKRAYPLIREVYFYFNRAPRKQLDRKLKEFVRYVVSREGQEAIVREGGFLPLTAEVAQAQLEKLDPGESSAKDGGK